MKTKPMLPIEASDLGLSTMRSLFLTFHVRKETLIFWVVVDETLDRTPDHGVLSHQDDTLSTETVTNLVHLLRADIVNNHDEDGPVGLQQALELVKVAGLVCGLAPHIFFE